MKSKQVQAPKKIQEENLRHKGVVLDLALDKVILQDGLAKSCEYFPQFQKRAFWPRSWLILLG